MEETNLDYRKKYYHLAGTVETALRILIAAQQDCENILLESDSASNPEEIARPLRLCRGRCPHRSAKNTK